MLLSKFMSNRPEWHSLRRVLAVLVTLRFLTQLRRLSASRRMRAVLADRAKHKRELRDAARGPVRRDWDDAVIDMTATELLVAMKEGTLTSEVVVESFIKRAREVGRALGTNADEPFEAAMEEAKLRDLARQLGKPLGPLHGLPISVKDMFDQEGCDCTMGLACRASRPREKDGLLVAMIRAAGGIPFVRTNVPQCLMLPESANAIWGAACNPHDPKRTVGGSSGGEAGLIAARGSPLGLGTDIGGSIRIPAALCGICGFKPTPQRMSLKGLSIPRPGDIDGQNAVMPTSGPLARSVEDLELIMQVWMGGSSVPKPMWESDPAVPRLPWRVDSAAASGEKLTFGYYETDGFFQPAPACSRTVLETVDKLRNAGHRCIEVKFDMLYELVLNYFSVMGAEGGMRGFLDGLEGEALHPMYGFLYLISNMPEALRAAAWRALRVIGMPRVSDVVRSGGGCDTYDFWNRIGRRNELVKNLTEQWTEMGLDAVVCPAIGLPAWPHGASQLLVPVVSYTFVWNQTHFPAGVVPSSTVQPGEEAYEPGPFKDLLSSDAARACEGTVGLPVGVQVVTLPWHDEECIKAMKEVERVVAFVPPKPDLPKETQVL